MRLLHSSRNFSWSNKQLSLASICLATLGFVSINVFKAREVIEPLSPSSDSTPAPATSRPSNWLLGDYADLHTLAAMAVGLTPFLASLCWILFNWLRPKPGAKLLDVIDRENLQKAFKIERGNIALATNPEHPPQAAPSKSARNIDLGDAELVVPKSAKDELRRFIRQPKTKLRANALPNESIGQDILIVTGEPGAGKSILLQELHSTLSLGVEAGHHSFIPVFLFARDLTLESLDELVKSGDVSMKAFLMNYYEARYKSPKNADRDLEFLFNHIKFYWNHADFLIIVDGLDEIAQRSAYEDIQRRMRDLILLDLKSDSRWVHRYILSCRIDEDLDLFPSARNLYLRGLTDAERERFCRAKIGERSLDRRLKDSLEEALRSHRLTPTHVFRRNPYFLTLLINNLLNDTERLRTRTTDFDVLMREHLRRESLRTHAPVTDDNQQAVENREVLYGELEGVSRACLQYIAFQSAAAAKTGALYDEMPIDVKLIRGFMDVINPDSAEANGKSHWSALQIFLNACLAEERENALTSKTIHTSSFTQHLHENDINLFERLALDLKRNPRLNIETLEESLGAIPLRGGLESPGWYKRLVAQFLMIVEPLAVGPTQSFIILLLLRSIAAAHVLRILNINISNDVIAIRFRHRRLAEYYSACYIRDRWSDLENSIELSPWLGPVLNLTCAIEGPKCRTLRWLVDQISSTHSDPSYVLRYSVEAAVEASFFAQPGVEHTKTVKALASKIVQTLRYGVDLDAVTQIVLLRAIEQLALLEETLKLSVVDSQTAKEFYEYEKEISAEWIAQVLPARVALQTLSRRSHPFGNKLRTFWKLIQHPGVILFSRFRMPWTGLLPLRSAVLLATVFSELCQLGLLVVSIAGSLYLMMKSLNIDSDAAWDAVKLISLVIVFSWLILKSFNWRQSPTKAASQAAALWRAPSVVLSEPSDAAREGPLLPDWYLNLLRIAGAVILLAGLGLVFSLAMGYIEPKVSRMVREIKQEWTEASNKSYAVRAAEKRNKPEPRLVTCPEIGERNYKLIERFRVIKTEDIPPEQLASLQKEIRREIEELRRANKVRECGTESDNGWELAEDALLDYFVSMDSNLIPYPSEDESFLLTVEEFWGIYSLLDAPIINEPEPDAVEPFATIYTNNRVNKAFSRLREARLRIVSARREGIGLPKDISSYVVNSASTDEVETSAGSSVLYRRAATALSLFRKYQRARTAPSHPSEEAPDVKEARIQGNPIQASIILINRLDVRLAAYKPIQLMLNARTEKTLLRSAVGLISFGMVILISRVYLKRRRDNKQLSEIEEIDRIETLCEFLMKDANSERVRLSVIRRLDTVGVRGETDLRHIERIAGELLGRASDTERNLGVNVAALVETLSNRLRHRITRDTTPKGKSLAVS